MPEFTGERLIPELVDADLLNEHMARYVLARTLAAGAVVLDAGCGVGYGTAYLAAAAAAITGLDNAPEALAEARRRYAWLEFVEGSCDGMPFEDARFDLVVAFEVIEHLEDWRAFLRECARVLKPQGQLLVSTPNKACYAASRGSAGPNPFHQHEFEFQEFQSELNVCFGHVTMLLQNHAEGVLIAPTGALASGTLAGAPEGQASAKPEDAQFFVALCGQQPAPAPEPLFYLPAATNVLRERERHIELLTGELALKDQAILERSAEHQGLVDRFRALQSELEERNQWALGRQRESDERAARIVSLQQELEERNQWALGRQRESDERAARILALQRELEERNQWALDREREAAQRGERIAALQNELAAHQQSAQAALDQVHLELRERTDWALQQDRELRERTEWALEQERALREAAALEESTRRQLEIAGELLTRAEATVVERTGLAQREQARAERLQGILEQAVASRWLRLGRRLGLGPKL